MQVGQFNAELSSKQKDYLNIKSVSMSLIGANSKSQKLPLLRNFISEL